MHIENRLKLLKNMRIILKLFSDNKEMELRIKANELMKEAVQENSRLIAQQSIIAYVLHKILTKEHIIKARTWSKNKREIITVLKKLVLYLEHDDAKKFGKTLVSLHNRIERIDTRFGRFVQSLIDKARVKYASDAYFLGASLGQAAALTGADKKTLLEYIGATKLHDKEERGKGIAERLEALKKALGV